MQHLRFYPAIVSWGEETIQMFFGPIQSFPIFRILNFKSDMIHVEKVTFEFLIQLLGVFLVGLLLLKEILLL